jgi:hypothetical protein
MISKSYLNKESGKSFLELTTNDAHKLIDILLLEHKIRSNLEKLGATEEPFDDTMNSIYLMWKRKK